MDIQIIGQLSSATGIQTGKDEPPQIADQSSSSYQRITQQAGKILSRTPPVAESKRLTDGELDELAEPSTDTDVMDQEEGDFVEESLFEIIEQINRVMKFGWSKVQMAGSANKLEAHKAMNVLTTDLRTNGFVYHGMFSNRLGSARETFIVVTKEKIGDLKVAAIGQRCSKRCNKHGRYYCKNWPGCSDLKP